MKLLFGAVLLCSVIIAFKNIFKDAYIEVKIRQGVDPKIAKEMATCKNILNEIKKKQSKSEDV